MQILFEIPRKTALSFLLLAMLTSGCAATKNPEAPIAENFPTSYQKQLHASSHWAIVAEDIASQIQRNIKEKKLDKKSVFINVQTGSTDFSRALNDFIITHLVKKNIPVSKTNANSYVYNLKIQPIQYHSHRSTLLPDKVKFTALAGGVVVVRNVAEWLNIDGALLGAGVLTDSYLANRAPNLELIITSSLVDKNLYLHHSSDIYYANQSDIHLYEEQVRAGKKIKQNSTFDDPFYGSN